MALKPRDIALRAASAVVLAPAAVLATWAGGDWFCALVVAGAVLLAFDLVIAFSDEMQAHEKVLRDFLMSHMYRHPHVAAEAKRAKAQQAREEKQRLADEKRAAAKLASEKAAPPQLTEAEKKAARDARYAARKSRK